MGVQPEEHEAMAAAEAARLGEQWPPQKSPCEACAEPGAETHGSASAGAGGGGSASIDGAGGGGGAETFGDIEDVGGKVVAGAGAGPVPSWPAGESIMKMTSASSNNFGASGGGSGSGVAGVGAAAIFAPAPYPPFWIDHILYTSACVGVAGVVVSWLLAAST
jgi:hypothetical protein